MKRVLGYDIARSAAIFGMILVNFKIVMGADDSGPEWLAMFVGLFEGRAAATFVVLAGIGVSLLARRGRVENDAERTARDRRALWKRAILLFVVGHLYAPIWPADILHFYGVYIAIGALFLTAPSSRLWWSAAAGVLAFLFLLVTLDYDRGWDWTTLTYHGFWTLTGTLRRVFFNGFHPVIPWVAFLLVGMAIGRLDLSQPRVRRTVFVAGAAVALAAEATSALLIRAVIGALPAGVDREELIILFGTEPMPPTPLYMLAGAGTACAWVAAAVWMGERFENAGWLRPFVSAGQLALTLYVAHVVVGMGLLEALGLMEDRSLPFAVGAAFSFYAASVIFAHLWRQRFRHGPLEALLRRATRVRPSD